MKPNMMFDGKTVVLDTKLVSEVMDMFEKHAVSADAGISSLVLVAARAAHETGMSPENFEDMCKFLRRLAEEDDLSKFAVQPGDA